MVKHWNPEKTVREVDKVIKIIFKEFLSIKKVQGIYLHSLLWKGTFIERLSSPY